MDNDDARRRWGRPVRLQLNGSTTFPAGALRLAGSADAAERRTGRPARLRGRLLGLVLRE